MTSTQSISALEAALGRLRDNGGPVRDWRRIQLPANQPPWTATGIQLSSGDEVSWLASGRVVIMAEMDLWMSSTFTLWARIGGGPIFKGTRETTSFVAEHPGPLELAIYQGEWGTRTGTLATPLEAYDAVTGGLDVILIHWRGTAADGIAALRAEAPGDPLVASEASRLAHPARTPEGWKYLWYLGDGEIFQPSEHDGHACISAHTSNDVGILQKPVSAPLTADTRIDWSWNLSRLPADVAEDLAHTHDYMSIAIEFDNGQDLTYYWSAALPEGTHYRCPLPTWADKETHWVLRSGPAGLGRWHSESRPLLADYAEAVGGSLPARIVGIWLIAVSLFRHGEGDATFRDIALVENDRRLSVL